MFVWYSIAIVTQCSSPLILFAQLTHHTLDCNKETDKARKWKYVRTTDVHTYVCSTGTHFHLHLSRIPWKTSKFLNIWFWFSLKRNLIGKNRKVKALKFVYYLKERFSVNYCVIWIGIQSTYCTVSTHNIQNLQIYSYYLN